MKTFALLLFGFMLCATSAFIVPNSLCTFYGVLWWNLEEAEIGAKSLGPSFRLS